jgi:hypothetical protein
MIKKTWTPEMEQRARSEQGRQVKCLIASEGHVWMRDYFDDLPLVLRQRLVHPSGIEGLISAQAVRGFASMVQRKGLAMVALK